MIIREIQTTDAAEFMDLQKTIEEETQYMMMKAGEREVAVAEQRKLIADVLSRDNQTIFLAEANNRLVGYLKALGGQYQKTRYSAYITIGVLKAYTRQGIGTQLFNELERWAKQQHIHRLELIVIKDNTGAVALYEKMGFIMEGIKRDSLFINGEFIDEYYMGKLLPFTMPEE